MKQQTLAMTHNQEFEQYREPTKRECFLQMMERVVRWVALSNGITGFGRLFFWHNQNDDSRLLQAMHCSPRLCTLDRPVAGRESLIF